MLYQHRGKEMRLARLLSEIGLFVRAQKIQMRFGELSRAPLRLLRFELRGETAECDWLARPADKWDADVARCVYESNVSTQALKDVMDVRELLFSALPEVESASLRVFRNSVAGEPELIITGKVTRDQEKMRRVSSLAMRAKLLGLHFWLQDGVLEALQSEECAMSF
jgi:hypothetical protein